MKKYLLAICIAATGLVNAQNEATETVKYTGNRADGHAPISVMGDHTHGKGELMFSYRFMSMAMQDLQIKDQSAQPASILKPNGGTYMVTPTKMPMNMHMLGGMYGLSNNVTVFAMANYMSMEMDHITAMGGQFTTVSNGLGDTKVGALVKLYSKKRSKIHANIGVSIPTGTIDNKDANPMSMGKDVILPYPMQIGSGTFDADLGATYLTQGDVWSYGAQAKGLVRLNENDNGYALGNRYSLNNWFAMKIANWISFSGRIKGEFVDGIKSVNPDLNPNMVFTANTANSGGVFVNTAFGINLYVPNGTFKGLRFGAEYGHLVYQNVEGVQLQNKETITLGLQYAL